MKVAIAGDFCPQNRVLDSINKGDFEYVLGETKRVLLVSDYSIVNLECPITKGGEAPISKCGPLLCCSESGIDAIKWAGFDCVTLANNHFLDYGNDGVVNTIIASRGRDIDTVGGGENINEAQKVLYKQIGGKTLAVINCCEHEFSIATNQTAGSNPLNPVQQYYDIQSARQEADYVLVIIHGGNEYYQLPSPRMKQLYRFFIDAGANAVINHHQHVFSGFEIYKGYPIFYGLGNFCFDNGSPIESNWNLGYLAIIDFNEVVSFEIIPYLQCCGDPVIHILNAKERSSFDKTISHLNTIISNDFLLQEEYTKFIHESTTTMRVLFSPYKTRLFKSLCRRKLLPSGLSIEKKKELLSYIQCESHISKVLHFLKR